MLSASQEITDWSALNQSAIGLTPSQMTIVMNHDMSHGMSHMTEQIIRTIIQQNRQ